MVLLDHHQVLIVCSLAPRSERLFELILEMKWILCTDFRLTLNAARGGSQGILGLLSTAASRVLFP